ncbi:MAG: tetratricopeptide repeat protein [Bacteroides sp.]|nr:tetratricopeptide repeat protein [Bacteroides sp.]
MRTLIITLLIGFLPLLTNAQSVEEIRKSIEAYDYETPIASIASACGDTLLTPLRAQALKAMNRYPEALKEWNSLLKSDSTDTRILIELAECYRLTNRTDQASICYAKAVSLQPENKFFRQQQIRSLLASEKYEAARDASHAWLERDTLSATGYKFLGMAYEGMAIGNPDALGNAFMAYNAAYRRDSLDGQTVAHIAAIFNDNNQFADAVSVTETYRLSDTLNVDVNRQNAKAYCMLKEYKTAVNRYEALKSMGDRSFTTLYYLGISHYGDNWFYGSQENLLEAHKKNPNDVNVLYYLAKSCARTSWKEQGVDFMNKALELTLPQDSTLARLYDGLLECYNFLPKADPYKKIEIIKKVYSYNKKYTLYYKIAEIYDRQKDYTNAVHYYEKYMALVPKDKQVALDDEGKPIPGVDTLYQKARRRVEKIKVEDFFRNGAHDDYFEPKIIRLDGKK